MEMKIRECYERVCAGNQLRQSLIDLRDALKDEKNRREFAYLLGGDFSKLCALLEHGDPKIRKNAASILGKMESEDLLPILFDAYKREQTLYVRADYLKAMAGMDCSPLFGALKERLTQLRGTEMLPEEQKHVQEEIRALQEIVLRYEKRERHRFVGWDEPLEIILTVNRCLREVTARQITTGKLTMLAGGIRIEGAKAGELRAIRTYREMLFPIPGRKTVPENISCQPDVGSSGTMAQSTEAVSREGTAGRQTGKLSAALAEQIGTALAAPVLELARRLHQGEGAFPFRLELKSRTEPERKGTFLRRISAALEQASGGELLNSVSDYELEIRLLERKDGTYLPMVKFLTIPDTRFAYRRDSVASSIAPANAALVAELARPYLKEGAQVLDPFCGVGTMLIERDRAVKTGIMYGVDIFGEAIEKAKANTERAGCQIYYVNKDFFEFEHGYRFDEIITDLPQVTAAHPLEEIRGLYRDFFAMAGRVLQTEALLVVYTTEPRLVTDAVRERREYTIKEKHTMNEKNGTGVFIIRRQS